MNVECSSNYCVPFRQRFYEHLHVTSTFHIHAPAEYLACKLHNSSTFDYFSL